MTYWNHRFCSRRN